MAEQLFWAVLDHLQTLQPAFGGNRRPKFAFRFKRLIHVVDATTIQLIGPLPRPGPDIAAAKPPPSAICDWICKPSCPAAPSVDSAAEHETQRARELCANIQAG